MSEKPWFKFYAADFLTDAKIDTLPPEAEGIVVRIWAICHIEGSCPAEPEELARKIRRPLAFILKYKSYYESLFELNNGSYVSARMERERKRSAINRSNVLKRSASSYKQGSLEIRSTNGNTNGSSIRNQSSDSDYDYGFVVDSKETNVTDESFTLDAAVSYVLVETGLAGKKIRDVVHEVVYRELKQIGIQPKDAADAMIVAWRKYDVAELAYKQGPENFFGAGTWRKSESEWRNGNGGLSKTQQRTQRSQQVILDAARAHARERVGIVSPELKG